MLNFFRRYEKYFFICITVVVVLSFSFFGTYGTIENTQYVDKTAFTAINGKEIKSSELEEMVLFLGTDSEDKTFYGGAWGPNFLNDGVIKKDFIENGLAQILIKPYLADIRTELDSRFQKERKFVPYENPQAKFLSATNAWNVVAPQINTQLEALRRTGDPTGIDAFDTRVKLFQAQRQFPPHILRFVLRYQEKQNSWVNPDPNLDRTDLSLFGYHTVGDWFGLGFQRLTAEFIINAAAYAEEQGYQVSRAEVLADLYRNAEVSYQQNINNPSLGVATMQQYFDEQLRRMRMDQSQAIDIWRKVMLFRRVFQDLGNSIFVDPYTIAQFENYANETIEGDLYSLPSQLHLGDLPALQKFELYLSAVSERPQVGEKMLDLPMNFKSADDISKKYPELVQRRYLLEYSKMDKRALQAKVGVKETWAWEIEDANWEKLKKKFPELAVKAGKSKEERDAALDALDKKTRARLDAFARNEIVAAYPEWLDVSLSGAKKEKKVVGITKKGKNDIFVGLKDPQQLITLLDKYPESKTALEKYSPDGETYYKIEVLNHSPDWEVLTFEEANKKGILDNLLDAYIKADGEKSTAKIVEEIKKYAANAGQKSDKPTDMIGDYAASYRLYPFINKLRDQFSKNPTSITEWVLLDSIADSQDSLPARKPLKDQWKLERKDYKANRGVANLPSEDAFTLKPQEWSKVRSRANGEITFFQLKAINNTANKVHLYEKINQEQKVLSAEAQRTLMRRLVGIMETKNSLSLKAFARDE